MGVFIMFVITKCIPMEKDGRTFNIIHFFDVESGEAGNSVVSDQYLHKLTEAASAGKALKMGYDKKKGRNFLYVSME